MHGAAEGKDIEFRTGGTLTGKDSAGGGSDRNCTPVLQFPRFPLFAGCGGIYG